MNNYDYPIGADTPLAPWNDTTLPEYSGKYDCCHQISTDGTGQYLAKCYVTLYSDNGATHTLKLLDIIPDTVAGEEDYMFFSDPILVTDASEFNLRMCRLIDNYITDNFLDWNVEDNK